MTGEKLSEVVVDALKVAGLSGDDEVIIHRAQIEGDGTHDTAISHVQFGEDGTAIMTLAEFGMECPHAFAPEHMGPDALRAWVEYTKSQDR